MQRVTYFLSCIEDLANCPLKSRGVLQKAASQVFFYNGNTQQRKGTTQELEGKCSQRFTLEF
jgi:hypothetical protein